MVEPDKVVRSSRKTLAVCIDVFGRITVRAPLRCTNERIAAFLQEKEEWILRKKGERAGAGTLLPPENLNGYSFLLLGKDCKIYLYEGKGVRFDDGAYALFLPADKPRERLIKWLKENAKRIFTALTEEKAALMQTHFQSVRVSSAKTRWGTCSADNNIRYTYRLLYAPKDVIAYVVVHELAHTKHKNHSPHFWREVEKYIPDWKERRKWLKVHGAVMEIF